MKVKRTKPEDSQTERYILIATIMSENVCRSLKNSYDTDFFQTKPTKEVSKWVMDFFNQYDAAPYQEIQSIFEMKSKAGKIEPDLEEEIERLLSDISAEFEEWEEFNEQFYIELGHNYFKKRSFIILSEKIKEHAESDDVDQAEKEYSNFTKVQEQLDTSRNVVSKEGVEDLKMSVQNKPPHLFKLPGALGNMIGPIERETFIGILGREKIGKTYCLMHFAITAARKGLNVAMIETGDLTKDQLDSRFYSYFTRKTSRPEKEGTYYIPILDCLHNQKENCDYADSPSVVAKKSKQNGQEENSFIVNINDPSVINDHEVCTACRREKSFAPSIWWKEERIKTWGWKDAERKATRFADRFKGKIITEAFPMSTVKASDIRDWVINKQKRDGFIPDILIVDYPDILLPEKSNDQYRHQENEKWMILRQISQEFHICVIVTTQADAKAYTRDTLQLDNYSEDKRKYGHTTHFLSINQSELEAQLGCARMATLLLREDTVKTNSQVTVMQSLVTSQFCRTSFFGRVPSF